MMYKNNLSLSQKLVLTQFVAFIVVYMMVLSVVPSVVYAVSSKTEAATAMHFNEQVSMRVSQCFDELKRFSGVVVSDNELNELLREYIELPDESNMARLRLYLSNTRHKDGVSSYRVLGMYLDVGGEYPFSVNTVGLSDNMKQFIRREVLPEYDKSDRQTMLIEPFVFQQGDSSALFGDTFTRGYGYVQKYYKNGIEGRLVIISSYDEISYIIQDMRDYCEDYMLLNENDRIIYPSAEGSSIDYESVLENVRYGDSYMEGYYTTDDGVYTVRWLDMGNWKLLSHLTRDEVLSNNWAQRLVVLLSVGVFGIVVILTLIVIVRKFVSPLSEVSKQMGAIAEGDLKARVPIYSEDEIGRVSRSFNIMAGKLETMIDEIIEKEKIEQRMRYSLLISQVDPHFIYNTMNTITYLAQKGRNEDVVIVNKAMIEVLRDRLRIEVSEVFDTVYQEVSVVKQYLIIQKYRYEGTFKVKYVIDREAENCLIMKNILQPLVENALLHGILENKDENGEVLGGYINIVINRDGDFLYVEVSDNGSGMSEERLAEILKEDTRWERGLNIGIRNVRERIRHIYNIEDYPQIQSKKGEGTKVFLRVPVDVEEGKNGNVRVSEK
ncbi:HAMP domain-containing protein [bacterium 1XD8-76]|nr:HAMP domain-containing protein [bacterium 1XD8-76]